MRRLSRWFCISAVALAACGGGRGPSSTTSTATPTTLTTTAPSSAVYVADVVARYEAKILQGIAADQACAKDTGCSSIAPNRIDGIHAFTTPVDELGAALKQARPVVPEVASLTDDTIALMDNTSLKAANLDDCLRAYVGQSIDRCDLQLKDVESEREPVRKQCEAWRRYLQKP